MRGFVPALLLAGLEVGPAIAAESAGEAIEAFGLIGSWSIDCGKQPTTETCTHETGCGVRIIYEVSPAGSPMIRTVAGSFIPGQGIRTIGAVVESAERIGDDRIRIVSVQQGTPGQFSTAMWLRQPGEHWESILLKVGPKFRPLSTKQQDGTKIAARDGFVVQPSPGTKHDELPATWITTEADAAVRTMQRLESRSDGIGTGLSLLVLTRFLHANRYPPTDQVRGHASLENALAIRAPARWRGRGGRSPAPCDAPSGDS